MLVDKFSKVTIITATRGSYLKLKDIENSEELIGKPERLILSNEGKIPDFEEFAMTKDTNEQVAEDKPVKKTRKTAKKK